MTKIFKHIVFSLLAIVFLASCEDGKKERINFVTFDENDAAFNVEKEKTADREIKVFATTTSSSDRTFEIKVDESSTLVLEGNTIPSNVTIPANSTEGILKITVDSSTLSENGQTLILDLVTPEGVFSGGSKEIDVVLVCPINLADFVGTWTGDTSYGYPTQVVTSLNGDGKLQITGIGIGFMENDWGEVITDMQTLTLDVDTATGAFTIAETYYMTTTYNGDPQPAYNLKAVGTLNACTGSMYLDYDFLQGGTSFTTWLTEGNGWPPFIEDIKLSVD